MVDHVHRGRKRTCMHDMVVREIRKAEQDNVEVPNGMMEIWEWKHDKYIDRVAKARIMLDMCQ